MPGKLSALGVVEFEEDEKARAPENGLKRHDEAGREALPPAPQMGPGDVGGRQAAAPAAREEEEDIFVGHGVDYAVPGKGPNQSPLSEDMEESPRNRERQSYFSEPAYGPAPPDHPPQSWEAAVSCSSASC